MERGLLNRTASAQFDGGVLRRNSMRSDRIAPSCRLSGLANPLKSTHLGAGVLATPRGRRIPLQIVAAVKKTSSKKFACSKTVVALPGNEDAVEKLCQQVVAFSKGRMADRSAGIIAFECSRDGGEANVFHFWELYESNTAMGRHNTAPEVEGFMQKVQPLLEGPIGMALYEMKNGKLGQASVQGGPRGEGGLDDATGATGAAGGASYKQTSGTIDLTNVEDEEDRGLWGIKFDLPWMKKKDKK